LEENRGADSRKEVVAKTAVHREEKPRTAAATRQPDIVPTCFVVSQKTFPTDLKSKNFCACRFLFEIVYSRFIDSRLGQSFLLKGAIRENLPTALRTPEESQVESPEHQDNADIHYQPFPESVSEEREIYTDYNGYHRRHVKHDGHLSAHFRPFGYALVGSCTVTEPRPTPPGFPGDSKALA
jgi:hypothetical protein